MAGVEDEASLIDEIRRAFSDCSFAKPLLVGIGDDSALWRPRAGWDAVLTCDWFLQGTHFLPEHHPAHAIGWKSLARAVSDLAAMGAEPRCFLLSLALPAARTGAWLKAFLRGLKAASRAFNCPAAGGDTTRRPDILVSTTVVGECPRARAILRSGAKPGDAIYVTGRLGEAEYGLRLLRNRNGFANPGDARLRKHLYPRPRLAMGAWLAQHRLATAMMDLSDGLSADLPRLCQASQVGASIDADRLPRVRLRRNAAGKFDSLQLALHGGDDYELLFTVAPRNVSRIPRSIAGTSLTLIGQVLRDERILLLNRGAETVLVNKGWDPFRR